MTPKSKYQVNENESNKMAVTFIAIYSYLQVVSVQTPDKLSTSRFLWTPEGYDMKSLACNIGLQQEFFFYIRELDIKPVITLVSSYRFSLCC